MILNLGETGRMDAIANRAALQDRLIVGKWDDQAVEVLRLAID